AMPWRSPSRSRNSQRPTEKSTDSTLGALTTPARLVDPISLSWTMIGSPFAENWTWPNAITSHWALGVDNDPSSGLRYTAELVTVTVVVFALKVVFDPVGVMTPRPVDATNVLSS